VVDRVVIGNCGAAGYQFRVSKAGYDAVLSDPMTEPQKFSFASDWNRLDKVLESGSKYAASNSDAAGRTLLTTWPGFIPFVRFQIKQGSSVDGLWYDDFWTFYDDGGIWDTEDDMFTWAQTWAYQDPTALLRIGIMPQLGGDTYGQNWAWPVTWSYVILDQAAFV
jgi:hypothetical protein